MFRPLRTQPPAPAPVPSSMGSRSSGPRYRAVYDYTAADDDEVSFQEGKGVNCIDLVMYTHLIVPQVGVCVHVYTCVQYTLL